MAWPVGVSMKPIFSFSSAKNSKDVCAWLNSLPVHDNYRYAEAVKKALYAYNAMELDDIERVRVLECFAPHVKTIATELNRNRVGVALPVTPKRQKVVNLIVSLHRGMADACLGMIHRETTSELGNQQSDRVLVSEIILNAIQHLTHILHLCYQTYQTEPGKIWTELHAVFLFALENDLVDLR